MSWITPIYNRTESDVAYAKLLIDKIKNTGYDSLSVTEKSDWDSGLKGCRNASDLNRIENNCEYLGNELDLELDVKTDWDYDVTPLEQDIQRICDNVSAIKEASGIETNPVPELPINNIYKLNTIEEILALVYGSLQND